MRSLRLIVLLLLAGPFAGCTGSATQTFNLALRFTDQPRETLAGDTMPAVVVSLFDVDIDVVSPANSGTVRITLEVNASGAPLALQGTTEAPLTNGVAVFDQLVMPEAGAGYVLRATVVEGGATDAVSQTFDIRPQFQVTGFSLVPNASDVDLNTVLEFTFSSPVAVTTVDTDSIRIIDLTTNIDTPARGQFIVIGNVVRFEPDIPRQPDLSDAGFLPTTVYAISIPTIVSGVRSIQGDELLYSFADAFATRSSAFLPVPGDLSDPSNHLQLPLFFNDDEDIRNGNVLCPRNNLPEADQDNPQVILTNPNDGSTGLGTVAGMSGGITYVRLPFLTLGFSEPIAPWLLNSTNIVVRNVDTNQTFDLVLTLTQDRNVAQVQIEVRDLGSPFMVDTVPSGNYRIELTGFTDLDGNSLVNADTCTADGTFDVDFSTP